MELIDERIYPKWEMGKTAPNNFSDFFTTFAHAAFCNIFFSDRLIGTHGQCKFRTLDLL
jgi:hypothetical protein